MEEIKNEAIAPKETEGQEQVVDIKALQEKLDQALRSQAGVDKSYAEAAKKAKELEAENERLKKEKMSEKEKAEYEIARQRAELEAKAKEVAEATLGLIKHKILGEKNVPIDLAEYIRGNDEAEIRANTDTFLKRFDEAVGKRVNERLASGSKPLAGAGPVASEKFTGNSLQELEAQVRSSMKN